MTKDETVAQVEDGPLIFWCQGCLEYHGVWLAGRPNPVTGAAWSWNGDKVKPTFTPSILISQNGNQPRCHSFVRDGTIQYLADCGHGFAGQTVRLARIEFTRDPDEDCRPGIEGPHRSAPLP